MLRRASSISWVDRARWVGEGAVSTNIGWTRHNDRGRSAVDVGMPVNWAIVDLMKLLLDFFEKDMLYNAESVPIR
jgi:hypothetical protein